jgi:molecular chaperone DnaK
MVLTRAKFEELTASLVERCIGPFKQAIADARLTEKDINEVILVGGSTRMPMIQELVRRLVGKEPNREVHPDEVVALGASIQAGVLAGDVREVVLLDVTPLTVGVETLGSVMTPMVPRNTTIPTRKTETYTTAADSQTQVEIHVMQGERPMARDNRTLGKFILDGIPPAPRGVPQVEVTFDIDANGILHVTAKDKATSREQSIKITGASTLDKKEVDRLVKEAEAHASEDKNKREVAETRNRADSLAFQVEKLLKDHGASISADERTKVEDAVKELREALNGEDQERLKRAIDAAQEASYKLSEEMYKASAASQAAAGAPASSDSQAAAGASGPQSKPDDVIDADYKPSN